MSRRSLSLRGAIAQFVKRSPPALLGVVEILAAHPNKALLIVEREIQHRVEFVRLTEQAKRFVWWRLTDALQGFVVMSILILSALWTFRGLARVHEWAGGIDPSMLPGGAEFFTAGNKLIAHSPLVSWPWQILAIIAILIVVGLFARHLGVILFSWQELAPLKLTTRTRREEMGVLEEWKEVLMTFKEKEEKGAK